VPEQLPRDQTYDVITALDVIEHIPDAVGALGCLRTALAPGGLLVCTVPAYAFLWGPHDEINHHCRRYIRSQLLHELEQAGLRPLWSSYFNTLLFPPIAAARLVGRLARSSRPPQSDLQSSPRLLNGLLKTVFTTERFLIPWLSMPVGVSLLAIARAPSAGLPENSGTPTSAGNAHSGPGTTSGESDAVPTGHFP
jgi:SAM-dependent methyltransferase